LGTCGDVVVRVVEGTVTVLVLVLVLGAVVVLLVDGDWVVVDVGVPAGAPGATTVVVTVDVEVDVEADMPAAMTPQAIGLPDSAEDDAPLRFDGPASTISAVP
jgi:hypothetical protein